jgi:beta-phosphoglucomutase
LYQAILFDFDGVLADTEPVHWACWSEVLAPYGLNVDWKTYRECCVGISDQDLIRFIAERCKRDVNAEDLFQRLYPLKKARFREATEAQPPISGEITDLLKSLDAYRLAVVTSSARPEIEPLLVTTGLRPLFGALVTGEDVARLKPAPDPYLLAARLLDAKSALVVEDSQAGLESGQSAGFDVLLIPHPSRTPELVRQRLVR